jgi:hypothetical protein
VVQLGQVGWPVSAKQGAFPIRSVEECVGEFQTESGLPLSLFSLSLFLVSNVLCGECSCPEGTAVGGRWGWCCVADVSSCRLQLARASGESTAILAKVVACLKKARELGIACCG